MNKTHPIINADVHVTASSKVGVRKIVPVGITVKTDINPIARYSYQQTFTLILIIELKAFNSFKYSVFIHRFAVLLRYLGFTML